MSRIRSVNPATLEVNGEVDAATAKDVDAAVVAARAAQPLWAERSLAERMRVLDRFRKRLLDARTEVAELVTREMGKPLPEALAADILPVLDAVKWLTTDGRRFLEGESFRLKNPLFYDRRSHIAYEPAGVVGLVSPWNYPLAIPGVQVLYALAAGNAVVLKPASATYLTAQRFRELLVDAGVPEDAFHVVVGPGREVGNALAEADVDHLIFTGSVPVGKRVEQVARARGVPTCLELGGSDPAIVLDDADVDLAANGIAWGRFTNAGQTCAAVKRVFVHDAVGDAFIDKLVGKVRRLRVGDPLEPGVDVGPLVDAAAVDEMEAFVQDATERGARILAGGRRVDDVDGHYFQPTVLADVPEDARVLTEEVFGPVLPVVRVADEAEAVARANDSPFGLTASVWTRDVKRGERVAARLDCGTVTVNDCLYTFAANQTPWGGRKDSGHGFTHGRWGLSAMVRMKHVNTAPGRRFPRALWWFPYDAGQREALEKGAAFLYGRTREKAGSLGVVGKLLRKRNL